MTMTNMTMEQLKNEIELHFDYYGKEINGFYKGFDTCPDTLDSMIYDLETSLRILNEIKERHEERYNRARLSAEENERRLLGKYA